MSPRPAQPPEQAEAKKFAIIQATLDAIVAKGPAAVRLGDVAKAVGMSIGTVQYYFESRDELLAQSFSFHTATVLLHLEEMAKPGADLRRSSARSRLDNAFAAVHGVGMHEQRSRIWIELVTAARTDDGLQNCVDAVFAGWRKLFRTIVDYGLERYEFSLFDLTAAEVVDTFIAIIDGFDLATVAGHGPQPETMTRILSETADRLLDG
ncbi:TetR/AcrR family transcriptional regulator [Brevibacterium spongiae]|uniref:TetR/AcrR family transcriptional regulator n=1 Tax=Brevibacterium spongiae TaxID=2909672 RepID=A0ABY5SJV9_9MICO|nr:TetR/AcrR family transcriptional regulator [Brevibacterium spongiae]UVI34823.1 TetR/AcrR family transcriptional regulator [Brevibacterium spongiae]